MQPPPDHFVVTAGGVDMRSGRYVYSHTDLSIGGDAGLQLTRTTKQLEFGLNPFGYFSHNFDIVATERDVNMSANDYRPNSGADTQIDVGYAGISDTFRAFYGSGFSHASSTRYAVLTYTGNRADPSTVYTYQSGDGTVITFNAIGSGCSGGSIRCAYASQLIRADGTMLNFEYDNMGGLRLRSVTSSRGQALLLEYASGTFVSKACVLNLARTVKPSNNVCPAGVPAATYAYDSLAGVTRLSSATDPSGAVWSFVNGTASGATTMGFVNPGGSSPWLTNTLTALVDDDTFTKDIVGYQSFADGQHYTYIYSYAPSDANGSRIPPLAGGSYNDANGNQFDVEYSFPILIGTAPGDQCTHLPCPPPDTSSIAYQMTAGPTSVTDPLNRVTTTSYADPNAGPRVLLPYPQTVTDPGGITTKMTWDVSAGNMLEDRQIAKSGSGLADLVKAATYNCTSSTFRYCQKPVTVTDPMGHTTNYTYAPEHGGVLTEMKPAPSITNGVQAPRPLKVTTWTQKYAYITNGSTLVAAATPVWVINTETVCQTVASTNPVPVCDSGAPQRVTTYQYGADGTANNLFVRGIAVTADGTTRRSCFTYDDQGNQISQTKPRGVSGICP
jgi:hypothetical protein